MAKQNYAGRALRVVLVWRGEALQEKVFAQPENISIGNRRQDVFAMPSSAALGDSFTLITTEASRTTFTLQLAPGLHGKLHTNGQTQAISELTRRGSSPSYTLNESDWGIVAFDPAGDVALFFQFLPAMVNLRNRPPFVDRYFGQALTMSALVFGSLLLVAWIAWEPTETLDVDPPPSAAIAKILLEVKEPPPEKQKQEVRKVREDDASKKAAGKEGKVGNPDSKVKETKIPKGPKDQIAAKVSTMGLLGTIKQSKQSAALKSLLSDNDASVTTALAGLKGAELAIGRGSGGMGTRGEGGGGGGTGKGQLLGVGNLAVGGGGHGAHNTGSGGGHVVKELKVSVTTGTPSADGGLSKEQILKVVQSHAAAIQFCYEKELQRFPHLAGKVVIGWKVNLEGRVDSSKVDSSSLGNADAESCMARQVRAWQFPKPNGVVCVVSFPFFFKGQ